MSNEYKDWKKDMDEEYYSCARAFARHIHNHSPDFEEWFVKNFPTVWEEVYEDNILERLWP